MSKAISAAEAKAHFGECLRAVEAGRHILITRYGRPVAALVAADELKHLERLRASGPASGLVSLVGRWDDGDELTAALTDVESGRGPERETPTFE